MNRYCLLIDMPHRYFIKADMALAGYLASSFVWVPHVNEALSTVGLSLGVFIAAVRAYKVWKYRNQKED